MSVRQLSERVFVVDKGRGFSFSAMAPGSTVRRKGVAVGNNHIVGLRSDGTAYAASKCANYDHSEVETWTGLRLLTAGGPVTFGLTEENEVKLSGGVFKDTDSKTIADAKQEIESLWPLGDIVEITGDKGVLTGTTRHGDIYVYITNLVTSPYVGFETSTTKLTPTCTSCPGCEKPLGALFTCGCLSLRQGRIAQLVNEGTRIEYLYLAPGACDGAQNLLPYDAPSGKTIRTFVLGKETPDAILITFMDGTIDWRPDDGTYIDSEIRDRLAALDNVKKLITWEYGDSVAGISLDNKPIYFGDEADGYILNDFPEMQAKYDEMRDAANIHDVVKIRELFYAIYFLTTEGTIVSIYDPSDQEDVDFNDYIESWTDLVVE